MHKYALHSYAQFTARVIAVCVGSSARQICAPVRQIEYTATVTHRRRLLLIIVVDVEFARVMSGH